MYSGSNLFSEEEIVCLLAERAGKPFVFLESAASDPLSSNSFLFYDFQDILTYRGRGDLDLFFQRIENALAKGFWLCGYFSYEFGHYLENSLVTKKIPKGSFPLAWLGVSAKPAAIIPKDRKKLNYKEQDGLSYKIYDLKPNITKGRYIESISKIKRFIEKGDTYQVNFTFKYKFKFKGSSLGLYLKLRASQPTSYMAFINTGCHEIISLSPELFFKIDKNNILAKPMKGTAPRSYCREDDEKNRLWLKNDLKNRAENLMIVDLIRNDLGRIAKTGTVKVKSLFDVEKYRTLYQMTSSIKGTLLSDFKYKNIFYSLFPSGSVTGAPKISTMKIIKGLEKEPRNIYTGSIGYISPEKKSCFNVAIRTILLERGRGEMGIGGGIVYDSSGDSEYKEACLKAGFLKKSFPVISIFETIRWDKRDGYYLIKEHLERISGSADYFQIPFQTGAARRKLSDIKSSFKEHNYRVKLSVDMAGEIELKYEVLDEVSEPVKVKISSERIDPENLYLYHKTTHREFYDVQRDKALKEGFFEVIYLNHKGEVTEGSISNIFVLINKNIYTPPVKCGLLPGVLRKHLLEMGGAKEKILYLKDLQRADCIYIGNSLRGLLKSRL